MKLIDADAFSKEMKKRQDACKEWTQRTIDTGDEENYLRSCGAYVVFVETKLLLENQPTIDAVEVVRCKDCKYWWANGDYTKNYMCACDREDFFCPDGERKEQNDD